ncbi:phospho-N-acetylmuramoyl-pentapeptide-transferase [Bacteriovoracaceae bacterium]|nr:phospho-N-acetylmuramoyl-pentapeptide-transferase [Bacteriovoracaceae bacterium]
MLYHLLYPLSQEFSAFNIFRYITFRSIVSFLIAAMVSIVWGKAFIEWMKLKQFGQVIRDDGPESHFKKAGTPTMGGVFIIGSVLFSLLLCGNFLSSPLLSCLFVTLSYFVLGFVDDYLKVLKNNSKGVSAKGKLAWQFITASVVVYLLVENGIIDTKLYTPFFKEAVLDLSWFYIPFAAVVIVGSSNAVNLTDGLDGLAIGPIVTSAATLGLLTYVAGHTEMANYLYIPYVENIGELTVLSMAIIGAGVGFLWYNSYPAQIFMGDAGSLSLGGALGTIAVLSKNELLFVLIGGVFVIEALSVIIQVTSYKIRKKRVFKMAPIHHHFELKGWPEPKVIVRFWIISILFALISIATLKMR